MKKQPFYKLVFAVFLCIAASVFPITGYHDTPHYDVVKHFDVIVIGAGAGTKLVKPVANKGLKVAVIEQERLGGTCLNRGCIPSKMLIHVADIATQIKNAAKFHLKVGDIQVRFEELIEYVSSVVDQESATIGPLYEHHKNITFYHDHATFLEDHILQVGQEIISADTIFIATGMEASIPSIEGLDRTPYMTYREALKYPKLPKKLLVIGGGYVAAELGYFYGALGAETHFFVRDKMLSREDSEIRAEFERAFGQQFTLHAHTQVTKVSYQEGRFTLFYNDPSGCEETIEGDALLVATGMRPLTYDLGLEHTSIKVNEQGYILVNDSLETAVKGVYAFGDCIGRYGFRHSANYEGEYLFKALFDAPHQRPIAYKPMPHAVFTHPQIASVGKTEDELKKEGVTYLKGVCRYEHSAMGMALHADVGFVKLLFDASSRKLIGAHIIGEEASNMIHLLIGMINMGGTVEDLAEMIYIHPALPEIVRNAVRQVK